MKSSYETELRKMTSHFELLTQKCLQEFFFRVTNSTFVKYETKFRVTNSRYKLLFFYFRFTNSKLKNKKLHFELLTQSQEMKSFISSY